jgi:hypothetical protein
MKKLEEYIDIYNKVRKDLTDNVNTLLKEEFITFFNENQKITALGWTQYPPHFNDGDACLFSVHELQYSTNWTNFDELEESLRTYGYEEEEEGVTPLWQDGEDNKAPQSIKTLVILKNKVPNGIMQDVFGDDVRVFITREAIKIEDYSGNHD